VIILKVRFIKLGLAYFAIKKELSCSGVAG
jgi:hypothetical protein